jgi:uncharacterized protein with HEPN domain
VPRRDWRLRVDDILNAVGRIERFTRGLVFETFANDERTIAAVSYELVVIGEAAKNVPAEVRAAAPAVPWQVMTDMRNVVAHGYFRRGPLDSVADGDARHPEARAASSADA